METPDCCPYCGIDVGELDFDRDDPGDELHDHLADHCSELDWMARGDRLCLAFAFGRY